MKFLHKRKSIYLFSATCFVAALACLFWTFKEDPEHIKEARQTEKLNELRNLIANQIGPFILNGQWLQEVEIPFEGAQTKGIIEYTIDPLLQKESEKILASYKPDYGAVVMMDATSGKILSLASYQKSGDPANLALHGSFPAASVFKIVTATAALDKYGVTPDTIVLFNGGNHTLYKKNVMSDTVNKWTRRIALREAFARSINTVFGRLTLERLAPQDLEEYAIRFGFNKDIHSDLPFDSGFTEIPKEKNYHLTELASGYNRVTRMSPIQGAMIAGSVVGDGVMRVPYIVDKIRNSKGEVLFQAEPITVAHTMSPEGAQKLKELMEATITDGTSRRSFRPLVRDKKYRELIIGGKTGSLTGDNPKGKVDWFVGYAMNEKQKVAIAALTVHIEKWTVRSSHIAQHLFRTHFKEQFSQRNEKFFNANNESDEPKAN